MPDNYSRIDIIVDLETASLNTYSGKVLQIGVFAVQPNASYSAVIDDYLGKHDEDTLHWWKVQSPALYNYVTEPTNSAERALVNVTDFIDRHRRNTSNLYIWGNSSTFDLTLLSNLYMRYTKKVPWKYYEERCLRTIFDVMKISDEQRLQAIQYTQQLNTDSPTWQKHNALFDAVYEAQLLRKCGLGEL